MMVDIHMAGHSGEPECLNFEAPPRVGDRVALRGSMFEVTDAWHQPAERPFGAMFAIVLSPVATSRHSDTGGPEPAERTLAAA